MQKAGESGTIAGSVRLQSAFRQQQLLGEIAHRRDRRRGVDDRGRQGAVLAGRAFRKGQHAGIRGLQELRNPVAFQPARERDLVA